MHKLYNLPSQVLLDAEDLLKSYEGRTLPVYREAEKLRQRWSALNLALEDYVQVLVTVGHPQKIAFEFNPEEAVSALVAPPPGDAGVA